MKEFTEKKEYLCAIGDYRDKKVKYHKVGFYIKRNNCFTFSQGQDGDSQLGYKISLLNSGNANVVLKANLIK